MALNVIRVGQHRGSELYGRIYGVNFPRNDKNGIINAFGFTARELGAEVQIDWAPTDTIIRGKIYRFDNVLNEVGEIFERKPKWESVQVKFKIVDIDPIKIEDNLELAAMVNGSRYIRTVNVLDPLALNVKGFYNRHLNARVVISCPDKDISLKDLGLEERKIYVYRDALQIIGDRLPGLLRTSVDIIVDVAHIAPPREKEEWPGSINFDTTWGIIDRRPFVPSDRSEEWWRGGYGYPSVHADPSQDTPQLPKYMKEFDPAKLEETFWQRLGEAEKAAVKFRKELRESQARGEKEGTRKWELERNDEAAARVQYWRDYRARQKREQEAVLNFGVGLVLGGLIW